jgi:exopolyphosphatase / guanosine-5'-triphosphate,3'-diphosphate pyrophosphatase
MLLKTNTDGLMPTPAEAGGASQTRRRTPSASTLYAALDLGTNNCRLLIAEAGRNGRLRIVDSYSQITRLGEGLAATGRLSDAAMERAMSALARCLEKIRRHRPARTRFIATQACRAASNGQAFLTRVKTQLGLAMETISPKEEAKYALLGSLDLIDPSHDFALVIDIGGGSTELCWVDAKSAVERGVKGCAVRPPILGWASFPVGVVTLADMFPPQGEGWYEGVVDHLRPLLSAHDACARFGPLFAAGRGQLIANSGTVTSLAAVSLRLERYVRAAVDGVWLPRTEADAVRRRLLAATPEERAAEPCIGPDRADLVLTGCAILEAVWDLWPASRLRVGDRGLREGILLSMIHGPAAKSGRRRRRNGR